MSTRIDREVLLGFVEESQSYLPKILDGLDLFRRDPGDAEALQEAHRYVHIIKGAAAMLGLSDLSHIAFQAEELLDEVAAGSRPLDQEAIELLSKAVMQIEMHLGVISSPPSQPLAAPEALPQPILSHVPVQALPRAAFSDDLSAELRDSFLLEAEDHLAAIARLLPQIESLSQHKEHVQDLRRSVHTLKGSAGLVGYGLVTQLAHRMEDALDGLFDESLPWSPEIRELLFASADALEDMIQSDVQEQPAFESRLTELYARFSSVLQTAPVLDPIGVAASAPLPRAPASSAGPGIRVPLERLATLSNLASELAINRSAFEQHFVHLNQRVEELHHSIERLRRISQKLETQYEASALVGGRMARGQSDAASSHGFDELELDRYTEFHLLSRGLTETAADIHAVDDDLHDVLGDFDAYLTRQERLTGEIQDKLMGLRMVPVGTLGARLRRTVRVTAEQRGKLADLYLEGEHVELDKTMLEAMADPLLHLLRNAVDHGIEPPAVRQALAKPDRGQIRLRAFSSGAGVVLQISDDGGGLVPELLRAAAVRDGPLTRDAAARLQAEELYALVCLPGFTTTEHVSEISGRGVGMDIVQSTIHRLKGTLAIHSVPGKGSTFTVRLPLTLAALRVLLVHSSRETFALPLGSIRQILRVELDEVQQIGSETVLRVDGRIYPLLHLSEVLRLKHPPDETLTRLPVVLLDVGDHRFALVVDRLLEGRDVVVKSLGNHLRRVHGVSGATLLGDGSVVLILEPADFMRQASRPQKSRQPPSQPPAAEPLRAAWNILIVDDSFSVRRVLSNVIRQAGWTPLEAKDGLDALELLQRSAQLPDLLLLDIEMPRMDGYELLSMLRGQEAFRSLPVVMLTSRTGEKHRQKALQLGASDYLVKPFQDEELLGIVRRHLAASRAGRPP